MGIYGKLTQLQTYLNKVKCILMKRHNPSLNRNHMTTRRASAATNMASGVL